MNKIITIILGLITGSAYAQSGSLVQDASMFAPAVSSKASEIMAAMFAGLMEKEGGNPLVNLIQNINSIALIVAGILITYQIMNALIATAHEGEFLGKKVNAATYPLRIALASAIIVPVKAGYAIVQIIVMWLVVQSIGFADQTWISYVSAANFSDSMKITLASPQSKSLASSVLENMVCVESLKKITTKAPGDPLNVEHNWGVFTSQNDTEKIRKVFGDMNQAEGFRIDQCGYIEVQSPKNLTDGNINSQKDAELLAIQATVIAAHRSATEQLITDISGLASKIVNEEKYQYNGLDLVSITNKYNNSVKEAASREMTRYDAFKSIVEQSKNDGFISSMFIYNKMADLADIVGRSVVAQNTVEKPREMTNPIYKDQYAIDLLKIEGKLANTSIQINNTTNNNDSDGVIAKTKRWVENKMLEEVEGGWFQIYPNEHPIMAAKRIGTNVLNFLISTSFALGVGAFLAGGLGGAAGAVQYILAPLWTVGLPLVFFTLIVIPITPIMFILGSIIAWVVSVVEAVIIAPFWAVMHIVHGDDMLGNGEKGYKLLLNILLKPVFIVVGVISSFVLIGIMSSFIMNNYSNLMGSLSSGSSVGILSTIFYYLISYFIITILNFTIMMSLMKLIFQLPDRIMQWITNSENTLGGSAQDLASAGSTAGKVSGAALAATGNLAAKGISAGAEKVNSIKNQSAALKEKENNMSGLEKLQNNIGKNSNYGSTDSFGNIKSVEDIKGMEGQLNQLRDGLGEEFSSLYNAERGADGNNSTHSLAFQNALNKTIQSNFEPDSVQSKILGKMSGDPKSAMNSAQALSKLNDFGSINSSSPEGKLLESVAGNPISLSTTVEALSKLKSHGENKGMLNGEINSSISTFASNVAEKTENFTKGNVDAIIVGEYKKVKEKMN